jgi:hypothetical protein
MPMSVTMYTAVRGRPRPYGATQVLGIGWLTVPEWCTNRRSRSYALSESFTSWVAALYGAAQRSTLKSPSAKAGRSPVAKIGFCATQALPKLGRVRRIATRAKIARAEGGRGAPNCVLPRTARRRREHGAESDATRGSGRTPCPEMLGRGESLNVPRPADPGGDASPLVVLYAPPM